MKGANTVHPALHQNHLFRLDPEHLVSWCSQNNSNNSEDSGDGCGLQKGPTFSLIYHLAGPPEDIVGVPRLHRHPGLQGENTKLNIEMTRLELKLELLVFMAIN